MFTLFVLEVSQTFQRMRKQTTIVVAGALRVKTQKYKQEKIYKKNKKKEVVD